MLTTSRPLGSEQRWWLRHILRHRFGRPEPRVRRSLVRRGLIQPQDTQFYRLTTEGLRAALEVERAAD